MDNIRKYTDESLMPMGKHKGEKLANVPAQHLLWLYDQTWFDKSSLLGIYIQENKLVLEQEKKTANRNWKNLNR